MKTSVSISDFGPIPLKRQTQPMFFNIVESLSDNHYNLESTSSGGYMMYLLLDKCRIKFLNDHIEINRPALVLTNTSRPFDLDAEVNHSGRYFCFFQDEFLKSGSGFLDTQSSPFAQLGGSRILYLNDLQAKRINNLFKKILLERKTEYQYKYEIIRNYIQLILHEALKFQPSIAPCATCNASNRLATQFIQLLDKQFPVNSPHSSLKLRTPSDFAKQLSVHVNHLNRAVRTITGKTTTMHINDRIICEAKILLVNTNWNVSEIAYCLGFEYPTYFNNFFKKQTNVNPLYFRM